MFGSLGGPELLLILVLALLLFGPRKLPEIGRTLGRGLSEFRKATTEFKRNLQQEVDLDQVRKAREGLKSAGDEIGESIAEARRLGVARGSVPEPSPSGPAPAGDRPGASPEPDAAESRET